MEQALHLGYWLVRLLASGLQKLLGLVLGLELLSPKVLGAESRLELVLE